MEYDIFQALWNVAVFGKLIKKIMKFVTSTADAWIDINFCCCTVFVIIINHSYQLAGGDGVGLGEGLTV